MSQKKQFRAQKPKATTKASKSARLPSTEKNAVFTLTGAFQKAKPDKAVKRQSGYYGCRRLHKRAEKLGVQVRKCYLSILSMLIKASEGIDTEPT